MLLSKLGIFGWSEADENLVLASLLTGDPLLMIGNAGSAKTHIANKIGQALDRSFLVYDASKAMFEDILGYPDIEKLKSGVVNYIPSKVTVWDKELILIDEINRAVPELQSKWLEIIRSRKIMGFKTDVKWVWAAMNPISYSATNALDDALIGRFSSIIYVKDILQMDIADRIKICEHLNGEDAPSIAEWTDRKQLETVSAEDTAFVGNQIEEILRLAAVNFGRLKSQITSLSEFLAKFADLLMRETKGAINLDGRRLGFIYRNILANRAIELAKAKLYQSELLSFPESARNVVQSSIPIGLNEETVNRDEVHHQMEICFDLLSSFFDEKSEISKVNLIYELFTTDNLIRKAEILLQEDLSEFVSCKAWNDLMRSEHDLTLLAYTALQVEAHLPGTVPSELLEGLSQKIDLNKLSTESIPNLEGESIEYIDEVEQLLNQADDLSKLIAFDHVRKLTKSKIVNLNKIAETSRKIQEDIKTFQGLITVKEAV